MSYVVRPQVTAPSLATSSWMSFRPASSWKAQSWSRSPSSPSPASTRMFAPAM
jgi:hypothetical protein